MLAAASAFILYGNVMAGNLEPLAEASDPGSAMYTLDDLYNRLDTGAAGAKRSGGFTDPALAPAGTGHTIDEIMSKMPARDDANGANTSSVCAGETFWGLKDGSWGLQTGIRSCADPISCYGIPGTNPAVCSGHGWCVAQDLCSCFGSWSGSQCEFIWSCYGIPASDPSVCSGHGLCYDTDACDCDTGWDGGQCDNAY